MKIIQAHFGPMDSNRKDMVAANKKFAEKNGLQYRMYTRWPANITRQYSGDDKVKIADELRFRLGVIIPDMVWVDSDAKILKLWKMVKKPIPYFPAYYREGKIRDGVDHFLFSVNGCTEWFENFWARFEKRRIGEFWDNPRMYGWPRKLTRDEDLLGNIRRIPKTCYEHLSKTFKERKLQNGKAK